MPKLLLRTFSLFLVLGFVPGCKKAPKPQAAASGLPKWVVGDVEPLALRNASAPGYLKVTHTAEIVRPRPLLTAEALEALNPGLTQALPKLPELLSTAEVSPKFKAFYDAKISAVRDGDTMNTHDYFDCATALHVTDAKSGRHAVVFQSDMDVDTDGTDPVRLPRLEDYDDARISRSFQPILSYSWAKSAADKAENPFIPYYADTLTKLRAFQQQVAAEAARDHGYIWQGMQKHFDEAITGLDKRAKYYAEDLRERRSLVGSLDPFIVVPETWPDRLKLPFSVQVGDFVAVVHGGKVYPCLIGDTGGAEKMGEASQKLARAINPKASGRISAVDDVAVTYVIFPQTRLAMGLPDLAVCQSEVARLLGEIGGLGAGTTLYPWQPNEPTTRKTP